VSASERLLLLRLACVYAARREHIACAAPAWLGPGRKCQSWVRLRKRDRALDARVRTEAASPAEECST